MITFTELILKRNSYDKIYCIKEIREAYFSPVKSMEYNKALCEKYPFLKQYGDRLYVGYSEDHELDYKYTWEDELPEGWRKAFCPMIWDELKAILEKADFVNDFRFCQIKEKFATLRLYYNGVPESIFDELMAWENKWEAESEKVCIECGKPAKFMTTGWYTYICEDCAAEHKKESLEKYGHEEFLVPMEDLKEFFDDRIAYLKKHNRCKK